RVESALESSLGHWLAPADDPNLLCEHELHFARAHLLVELHCRQERLAMLGREPNAGGKAGRGEQLADTNGIGLRQAEQFLRERRGADLSQADGLAVQVAPVARRVLNRVADGVTKVQNRPRP